MRILIAEDLAENQLLIEVYMQRTPHILTFVEDGGAAVEAFRMGNFDLILMDVQMPLMDGLAATRAIRALERERGAEAVPIIALTAGGWFKDLELSREAGCTGHLAKPFSLLELMDAVQAQSLRGPRHESAWDASETDCGQLMIEIPAGLERIGPEYLSARRRDCETLSKLIASCEFEPIRKIAHNMKGSGRPFGFGKLTELGSAMESAANAGDIAALNKLLSALEQYLRRVTLKSGVVKDEPANGRS